MSKWGIQGPVVLDKRLIGRDGMGDIARYYLRKLRAHVPFDVGLLIVEDECDGRLRLAATHVEGPEAKGIADAIRKMLSGPRSAAGAHGGPLPWHDSGPGLETVLGALGLPYCSVRSVELSDGSAALLLLGDREVDRRRKRGECLAVEQLSTEMACTLRESRKEEKESRRVRQLKALLEISGVVVETGELPKLMEKTLESINAAFDTELGYVMLLGEGGREIDTIVLDLGGQMHFLETGLRNMLASRVEDRGMEPLGQTLLSALEAGSGPDFVLGVPIEVDGETAGLIKCSLQDYLRADAMDMEFLNALANQVSMGIRRIRDFEKLAARAEELSRVNAVAEEERAKLSAVFDAMRDAILVADDDGRLIAMNREAERLFRANWKEAAGRPVGDVTALPELAGLMSADRATGGVTDCEIEVPVFPPRYCRVCLAPVTGAGGEVVGRVAVMRDETLERELDARKREFMSCVSHELRTPITAIKGFSHMLSEYWGEFDDEQKQDLIQNIFENTAHLEELVEDILFAGSLSSRGTALAREECDAAEVAMRVTQHFSKLDREREYRFVARCAECLCEIDRDAVAEALRCLVDNAKKFSGPGTLVEVSSERDRSGVYLKVKDEGVGISPWHMPFIFEKFTQVDSSDRRPAGGTGNGLFLANEVVKLHGGFIQVASEPGSGSLFTVFLPVSEGGPRGPERG